MPDDWAYACHGELTEVVVNIMLAAFALAIGLIRVMGRLISKDAPAKNLADDPPDTAGTPASDRGRLQ